MTLRRGALVIAALLALTACGSGGGRPLNMADAFSRDTTTTTAAAVPATTDTSVGAADTAGSGVAVAGRSAVATSTSHATSVTRAGKTVLARGVKSDRIILGWEGLSDSAAGAVAAVGVTAREVSEADQKAQVDAMVKDINARGGIGGKKVVMLYHFVDVTQGTADTRAQQTCEFFTNDNEIFALVLRANHNGTLSACMAQHKTPVIDVSSTVLPVDQKDLDERYPYLYLPLHVNLSRLGAYIDALAQQHFLDGGARVGLLRYDMPAHKRARDQVIVPALARHGSKLTDEFAFTPVREVADLGQEGTQAANAALRFKAEGINRVIFLPSAWTILTVFPKEANSAGYKPRYGVDSWESPEYLRNNAPAAQLQGAVGLGWLPHDDVPPNVALAEERTLPDWSHCAAALKAAGYPEDFATYCTPFLFLKEAMARGTGLTAAGLRAGADKLGAAPYSTANFGTFFGPGRSDGASLGRNIAFDGGCACFTYVSAPYPIP
ncbi:MAG TPA: ABC transporter substrate-binding protein [Acidimicrobiales bacterium]|nr:ABC transporter substrate-binding protein [Acidimicrobiales bacterium]